MADIKIFNAKQIGANYTVVSCDDKKVMIDYGQSLPGNNVMQEDFDWENDTVDAVFFTHYHGDHIGRIMEIPDNVKLYMGGAGREIMLNIHRALAKIPELYEKHIKYVRLLEDDERIVELKAGRPLEKIGNIEIVPYMVDHSAYDSYMFLIKTPDENILHTGDFREHGYRGAEMIKLIEKLVLKEAKGHIDTLIIEGTMMERIGEHTRKESELKEEAKKIFENNKYAFLVCSSTNLDTLASFHKAAIENDMYTYCYSQYMLGQLETFTKYAGQYSELYKFDKTFLVEFDKILRHKYFKEPKSQERIMREKGFLCIIKPEEKYKEWIERFSDLNPVVIYSMWDGYLDSTKDAYNEKWAEFFKPYKENEQFVQLHTSGHATPETIAKIIETVKPKKRIYPIHTGKVDEFLKLNIKDEYKQMMVL